MPTPPYYPGALYTPNFGLALFGMDEVLAENFVIIDANLGGGGGGGNLTGTLTPGFIPVATGLHTLGDGSLQDNGAGLLSSAGSLTFDIPSGDLAFSVDAGGFSLDTSNGNIAFFTHTVGNILFVSDVDVSISAVGNIIMESSSGDTSLISDSGNVNLTASSGQVKVQSGSATGSAQGAIVLQGTGLGSVFSSATLVDVIQETSDDWGITVRNAASSTGEGLAIFTDENGDSWMQNMRADGTTNNGIIMRGQGQGQFIRLGNGTTTLGLAVHPVVGSDYVQVDSPLIINTLITTYNGVGTTSNGIPAFYGAVNAAAQAASISIATLYTTLTGGATTYRITYYMRVTQAATTSGSVTLLLQWIEQDSSVMQLVVPTPANNAVDASGMVSGTVVIDARAPSNISYSTTYASTGATPMQYKLRLKAEAL